MTMGWNCSINSYVTVQRIQLLCIQSTGIANTWDDGPRRFFFEDDSAVSTDGSISGTVFLDNGEEGCLKLGQFVVARDGVLQTDAPELAALEAISSTVRPAHTQGLEAQPALLP